LPDTAKDHFGWGTWALAALPAGLFTLVVLVSAIRFFFPPTAGARETPARAVIEKQLRTMGPLSFGEWVSIGVLTMAILGWLSKPLHGIAEAWVALAGFIAFLVTGVTRKDHLKNGIDWTFLLFFGVISSMGDAVRHLKIDHWLMEVLTPLLFYFSSRPEFFLAAVLLLVYAVRFVLHKSPVVLLLMVGLMPWAQSLQIHPGLLVITILLGLECWFLPYQTDSYLIAYSSTGGNAFSHRQAQKVMALKFITSFLALAVSIPYWRALGLMP
jgi:di/tricarboxylate transporter